MGRYYARNDGLPETVADAIEDHYKPRFAGDDLPRGPLGTVVALADKLETLAGMFGIGQTPTGDKDPFALRRHALGVIRMLMEGDSGLRLDLLIGLAVRSFSRDAQQPSERGEWQADADVALAAFIHDRLSGLLREQGYAAREIEAVLSLKPQILSDVPRRLAAVRAFSALPEAEALAAANKRVDNILKKSTLEHTPQGATIEAALLREDAERALAQTLDAIAPKADVAFEAGDYTESLKILAALRAPVDAFFDQVMVNTEDPALRANRLALLARLHAAMNRVANLARLSG
jgi:glycyl-tRNA synthetase beta chain